MKIVDYLIIVSTWLLSSYTLVPADVEFKLQNELNGAYTLKFGVLVQPETKVADIEHVFSAIPNHTIKQVTKTEKGIVVQLTTTQIPDVFYYRNVVKAFGFNLDAAYLNFYSDDVKQLLTAEHLNYK